MVSLWGEEFEVPDTSLIAKKVVKKIANPKKAVEDPEKLLKSKNVPITDKLRIINENVKKVLGGYETNTIVIKTREELISYIDKAIDNNIIAIDTETDNSLDPLTCKLMGPCIYTPGMKNAYIPLNHKNPETGERLGWQLTEQDIAEQFERLSNTQIIMHNGSFDYQVIKCTTGVALHVNWDTMVGARLLNENERAGLKFQYVDKIDASIDKYSINSFFANIEYAVVDPDVFALYAATDAYMTYKLYLYQKELFESPENERLYNLFKTVEMPIMLVAAEMELTGVEIDQDYAKRLADFYHKKLDILNEQITEELDKLSPTIEAWRKTSEAQYRPRKTRITKSGDEYAKSKSEQLADPPEITSPTQLAILIYDVLKLPSVDKKTPRGTGEPVLEKLIDRFPLGKAILEKRGLDKLLNTFVEAIPAQVSVRDKRLHAHFNTCGTDTGRFSSSQPNLQNIPSSEKSIRLMFKAKDGYSIVGGDFSQQEPRLLSHYSGDESMINAYKSGKDLYATMAAQVHGNDYWDNMEHHQDGTPNPLGKKRRSEIKSVVLGRRTIAQLKTCEHYYSVV